MFLFHLSGCILVWDLYEILVLRMWYKLYEAYVCWFFICFFLKENLCHVHTGDYDTQSLVEMLALHLDASYGACDTWQELASCLLKLSQCEGDRESACDRGNDSDNRGCLYNSNRVPELFTCGESGKSWRLRCRWWLNRHFHDRILMSEIASGNNPFRFVCFMDEAYK